MCTRIFKWCLNFVYVRGFWDLYMLVFCIFWRLSCIFQWLLFRTAERLLFFVYPGGSSFLMLFSLYILVVCLYMLVVSWIFFVYVGTFIVYAGGFCHLATLILYSLGLHLYILEVHFCISWRFLSFVYHFTFSRPNVYYAILSRNLTRYTTLKNAKNRNVLLLKLG